MLSMTRLIFWEDAYKREFDARVISSNGVEVVLDQTCFFASSGGQPSDTGTISDRRVVDVRKEENDIVHVLEKRPSFNAGDLVHGVIDWERRYRIMRLHSACHVISGVLLKGFNVRRHTGIRIYEDRARMDFDMEKLDATILEAIEREANKIVESHLEIVARILSWEEVKRDPELMTVSEERYEKFEAPRVLEIAGFDRQLDGGTHVANTREIGKVRIVARENKGKNNKRITLIVE
jgi:misacylated tRNA(Ala) deacylase